MSGYTNPDRPGQRLSDAERDEAVGHLAAAQTDGRITPAEYADRAAAARAAVTRGDLVPLFADLPDPVTEGRQPPRPPAPPAPGAWRADDVPPLGYTGTLPRGDERSRGSRALGGRVGATIMALTPFIAVGLFFLFGFLGSFAWSWLWFLLVPIVGIVIYGPGSEGRSRR
ncbi:DUF1707 domain-containing protein [Agromyces sp. SYSU K20354]|uniref:DUF1707 SHOCT-like domain-containing protein n=1 Tax=Agromyces cavernae TaxID=2898659 RepID=UPI001E31AFE3|nr:DUF1707 domain-containing protein [Agromyces cavernae]MCD2443634.1 DUF1707 domain-containing protein [Agromyces cavernae]